MKKAAIAISLLTGMALPQALTAQRLDNMFAWMTDRGFSIRRTFDGSSSEGKPATLYFVEADKPSDDTYYLIDVAAKLVEKEFTPFRSSSLLVYPTVEWHRSTSEQKPADNLSLSLKAEFRPVPLLGRPGGDAPPGVPKPSGVIVAPTFLAEVGRYWDEVADSTATKLSLYVFPMSFHTPYPGSSFRRSDGTFLARYYPYAGVEHWESKGLWDGEEASFFALRAYVEIVPIASGEREFVEVISDYTHRFRMGGDDPVPDELGIWTTSITLYPNGTRQVGIGLEYVDGHEPSKSFVDSRRWSLGVKFKL